VIKVKHHFVPRFYLKRFALDRAEPPPRQIRVVGVDRDLFVPSASLADQAYRRRFYGNTNDVEDMLSALEGRWAKILRTVDRTDTLPTAGQDLADLLLLVAFQALRTERTAEAMAESFEKFAKSLAAETARRNGDEEMRAGLDLVRVSVADPVLFLLTGAGKAAMCIADLGRRLLTAPPGSPFVTSDHPVQLYNLYCQSVRLVGVTGFVSTGLLVFVPLSPERCLLLYDRAVYKLGSTRAEATSDAPLALAPGDVDAINLLQYAGAHACVYGSEGLRRSDAERLRQRAAPARALPRVVVQHFEDPEREDRSFVMTKHLSPDLRLDPAFISVRRKARRVPLYKRAQHQRMDIVPPDPFDPAETWEQAVVDTVEADAYRRSTRSRPLRLIETR
jgi:hypothetical protein